MSIAFLVIDMQKEFYELEHCKETMTSTIDYINETAELFRKTGNPVVIIQDEEAGEGPGSKGYEFIDDIKIEPTDIKISKIFSNAFWKTDLEKILKEKGVKFVVISGFAAEYCVLFTLNGAEERGFGASLLQHGVAGLSKAHVDETHLIRATVSLETIFYMLTK